eukprot:m.98555 g.98555  ORF g.98555 m.98555 type:complete len:1581 (-) comp13640_c0_seq5:54-4796(-)
MAYVSPMLRALSLFVVVCAVHSQPRNRVSTDIAAVWKDTPLLLEACELMAREGGNQPFWTFLEAILSDLNGNLEDESMDEDIYKAAIKHASTTLTPLTADIFKMALDSRTASPAVSMQHRLSTERIAGLLNDGDKACNPAIEAGGKLYCELEAFEKSLGGGVDNSKHLQLDVDHVYPGNGDGASLPVVVLYAHVGSKAFMTFHNTLKKHAMDGNIVYVLRHNYMSTSGKPILLSGYGVELDIKKIAYLAVDDSEIKGDGEGAAAEESGLSEVAGFHFETLAKRFPDKSESLSKFRDYLLENTAVVKELKVWQLQDVSVQAMHKILSSDNKLDTMINVCENYPVLAHKMLYEKLKDEVMEEVKYNQEIIGNIGLQEGSSLLMVDSYMMDAERLDIMSLTDLMKTEAKVMDTLQATGLPPSLVHVIAGMSESADDADSTLVDTRSSSVLFYNDLESKGDKRYKKWSKSMMDILRPAMPGQLRRIARNMFTAVVIIDPWTLSGLEYIAEVASLIDSKTFPVRVGFLFKSGGDSGDGSAAAEFVFTKEKESKDGDKSKKAVKKDGKPVSDEGTLLLRAFTYIREDSDQKEAFAFLVKVAKTAKNGMPTIADVKKIFIKSQSEDAWESVETDGSLDKVQSRCSGTLADLGLSSAPVPTVFVNGLQLSDVGSAEMLEDALHEHMQNNLQSIQKALYYGELQETEDLYDWHLTQPGVVKRVFPRLAELPESRLLPLGDEKALDFVKSLTYLSHPGSEAAVVPDTTWIVADFNSKQGQRILFEGLRALLKLKKTRIALIHNGGTVIKDDSLNVAHLVYAILKTHESGPALNAIGKSVAAILSGETDTSEILKSVKKSKRKAVTEAISSGAKELESAISADGKTLTETFKLNSAAAYIIVNAHIVGPLDDGEVILTKDFTVLEAYVNKGIAPMITKKLSFAKSLAKETHRYKSDLILRCIAALQGSSGGDDESTQMYRRLDPKLLNGLQTDVAAIKLGGEEGAVQHSITFITDPLSKAAQVATPILKYISENTKAEIKIVFNPKLKVSEAPLKRFYKTVLPETTFSNNGSRKPGPSAVFNGLPTAPLLTLAMHVPSSWMVQAADSPHDLDNIHLEKTAKGVYARFQLEYILVEGNCVNAQTRRPTPGLQFELGTTADGPQFDTIVMSNLGYFQLKALPGVWQFGLREGRSRDIYEIKSHVGMDSHSDLEQPVVAVNDLSGKFINLKVARRPRMEKAKLLESSDDSSSPSKKKKSGESGLWSSLKSLVGGGDSAEPVVPVHPDPLVMKNRTGETINVFSLASGHLYERFLKIMMLSVLKATENPVKFWFLKNCMSPQLQSFLPYFANKYGFEYQLIQYKWPSWLNLPPTKHRQIWGYKILFLDVLFPLDVKKFIFVDADQVVRADLKELVELDLEGAPYGYTPFCDDRKEMDGFRFWHQGYWKNHLNGRPYHISALYVVDLVRFRQLMAGDRLREQYQGLSRDPNSLSNLDQDLPNNMVHEVPIKSLPQSWLWCETWCSDDIKPQAKTIDLCNNPLTKEPKLEAAVRILPEWTGLDAEQRKVTEEFLGAKEKIIAESASDKKTDASRDEL